MGAHRAEAKDRLNRLKNRRWYRPCAPMVALEDLEHMFQPGPDLAFGTPSMSFAPPMQDWAVKWFPAVAHIDSTARPQSVNRVDDPWLHSLLSSVRDATDDMWKSCGPLGVDSVGICVDKSWIPCGPSGINTHGQCVDDSDTKEEKPLRAAGVLINTSLNPKGKPIATSLADIFAIFCSPTGDELDFVLLQEKWLFERESVRRLQCPEVDVLTNVRDK